MERLKYDYIGKTVYKDHLGSSSILNFSKIGLLYNCMNMYLHRTTTHVTVCTGSYALLMLQCAIKDFLCTICIMNEMWNCILQLHVLDMNLCIYLTFFVCMFKFY